MRGRPGLRARVKPLGSPHMVDRQIWLAAPQPKHAAEKPAPRRARIEGEAAFDQRHHGCDVFAESRERERGSVRARGSSPITFSARRAKSSPFLLIATWCSPEPALIRFTQHIAACASAGPKYGSRAIASSMSGRECGNSLRERK